MSAPRVSVLLPTLDGEPYLEQLLPALLAQEVRGGFELRAVDSGSSDLTRWLLRRAGAAVERIERSEFRHGATRNRLAQAARGDLLVFLSQDALPVGSDFLARLIEAFDEPRVAGVAARILPRPDDDPLTARTALALADAVSAALEGPKSFEIFNDVASAVRRDVLAEIPFPDVDFGEDAAWAHLARAAGWRIAHAPEAVVWHAHRYTARQAFERYRIDAAFHRRAYGERVRPGVASVLRGFLHEVREDVRFVRRERSGLRHLWRSPGLRAAQVLGQYAGSRGPGGGGGP